MKQGFHIIALLMIMFINGQSPFPLTETNRVHAEQENVETDNLSDSVFNEELLHLASKGELIHAQYPIGTNINDIIANIGSPDEQGVWGGANFYVYGDVMYFVPFDQEVVTSIEVYLSRDESLQLRHVEAQIGKSTTGIEKSELDHQSFLLYECDPFILYIEANNEHDFVKTLFLKQRE
ncbi:DUF4309 domain-containing protein [Pueribacillus sp. YX66]|uniref:DUF4309 domain-containing protein n=1 Tax=Pueribacillus sp. YX66 TaxID=3229242 RepID=UPI00358D1569